VSMSKIHHVRSLKCFVSHTLNSLNSKCGGVGLGESSET
jgi:hypothetical protein